MKKQKKYDEKKKIISHREFDRRFDKNEDISEYLSFNDAIIVNRINITLPKTMSELLDKEALKLNLSKEAVIKLWLFERLEKAKNAA